MLHLFLFIQATILLILYMLITVISDVLPCLLQIALFTALLFSSIAVTPKIDVGLDQELALPKVKQNLHHAVLVILFMFI